MDFKMTTIRQTVVLPAIDSVSTTYTDFFPTPSKSFKKCDVYCVNDPTNVVTPCPHMHSNLTGCLVAFS